MTTKTKSNTKLELQLCQPGSMADLDRDWIAERKLDGVRAYTLPDGSIHTRSGNDVSRQFPEFEEIPDGVVLDGEIVTFDFAFDTVMSRVHTSTPHKIDFQSIANPAYFVVFDCLEIDGNDFRGKPLRTRLDRLADVLADAGADGGRVIEITHADDPHALWERVIDENWEGLVLKDPDSTYAGGRSDRWLKIKNWSEETFPIVDWERTDDDGFVIRVDIGTDEPQKVVVNGHDDQADVQNGADSAVIQFLERSKNDRLRKPSFKGVA